jgi:hypothetical protein
MLLLDFTNSLLEISELSTIAEIWKEWEAIANMILPCDYELRNACEDVPVCYIEDDVDLEWLRYEIRHLASNWRSHTSFGFCYWIDYHLRKQLGIEFRA